jgi:hypothetical protein
MAARFTRDCTNGEIGAWGGSVAVAGVARAAGPRRPICDLSPPRCRRRCDPDGRGVVALAQADSRPCREA